MTVETPGPPRPSATTPRLLPLGPWLVAALLASILALATYAAVQQTLRRGANDPQVQLAEDAAARLEGGAAAADVVPPGRVDLARSLAPFVTVVRGGTEVAASNATLHGRTPLPPPGVLATIAHAGAERVTWQPESRVRIALVGLRVQGREDLVVLSGRSLREVESRIGAVGVIVGGAWIAAMVVIAGAIGLALLSRPAA